ncbi:MAG: hypothetical protein ACRDTE_27650, partial [Pseudonocardiaceae bacterium]
RLDRAGIRDLFVVGGDVGEPAGTFADGLSLLQAMAEIGHRLTRSNLPASTTPGIPATTGSVIPRRRAAAAKLHTTSASKHSCVTV